MNNFKRGDIIKDNDWNFLVLKTKCVPKNNKLCFSCNKIHSAIPCGTAYKKLSLVITIGGCKKFGRIYFRGSTGSYKSEFIRHASPDELLKIIVKIKEEAVREEVKAILKERLNE